MNILLIVASGKSSRFGGFPKAFASLGKRMNVENTIDKACNLFDSIYLMVNEETYNEYSSKISGCKMFSIFTGQGDAHSLLKGLTRIKEKCPKANRVVVCWGDAVFVSDKPLKQLLDVQDKSEVVVACSNDSHPYAWFDIDNNDYIVRSYFKKTDGDIEVGKHDQSLFSFDLDYALRYLNEYREYLHIPFNNTTVPDKNEMKLLDSFTYLYKEGQRKVKYALVEPNNVLSFNTVEELDDIKKKIN